MTQLLDIKVMSFECRMSNLGLVAGLDPLKEEGMVIGVFQPTVNVEEAGDGLIVRVYNV